MIEKKISLKTNSRDINSLIQILLKKFGESNKDVIHYNELRKDIDLGSLSEVRRYWGFCYCWGTSFQPENPFRGSEAAIFAQEKISDLQ